MLAFFLSSNKETYFFFNISLAFEINQFFPIFFFFDAEGILQILISDFSTNYD